MELRARIRPTLRRAGLMAAAAALLVPATGTATADAKSAPVVKRVTPKKVFVGETMTIRGRHFRRGVNKNMVAFKRKGAKVVLVPAERGTTKLLKVELPKRLEKVLLVQNGTPVPTPLQVRVMSARFGKRFTSRSKSPLVGPERPPAPPRPKEADPNGDCDGDGQINRVDTDDDNDLLTDDGREGLATWTAARPTPTATRSRTATSTSPPATSTTTSTRRPTTTSRTRRSVRTRTRSTRPTASTDHDGDDLTLLEEYKLWKVTIANGAPRTLASLGYSAGEQYSINVRQGGTGNRVPTLLAARLRQAGRLPRLGRGARLRRASGCRTSAASSRDGYRRPWPSGGTAHQLRHPRHGPRPAASHGATSRPTTTSTRRASSATPSATRTPTASPTGPRRAAA